jgi:hypothetical protein
LTLWTARPWPPTRAEPVRLLSSALLAVCPMAQ